MSARNKILVLLVGPAIALLAGHPLTAGTFRVRDAWNTVENENSGSLLVRTNAKSKYEGNHVDANDQNAGMHTTIQTNDGGYTDGNVGAKWKGPFYIGQELRCTRNHNGIALYGCAMRAWIPKPWCTLYDRHDEAFYSGMGHVVIYHQFSLEKNKKQAPKTYQMPCKNPPGDWDGWMPPPREVLHDSPDPHDDGGGGGGGNSGGGCVWITRTALVQVCDSYGDCRLTWETYWDCIPR